MIWLRRISLARCPLGESHISRLLLNDQVCTSLHYSEVEVADGVGDLGAGIGEPFEMFEKEDMSDMFRRAMLEKMQLVGKFYNILPAGLNGFTG